MEQDQPQAPQWLLDVLNRQTEQMTALADKLEQLSERQSSLGPPTLSSATPSPTPTPQVELVRRPKAVLPDVTKFDGTDKTLYPQFAGSLRAKLEIDGEAIGGEKEKVWYGFGRLKGEGASRVFPWIEHAQRTNNLTVEALFHQMDIAFQDPRTQEKALATLNKTKQRTTPFGEFLGQFDRLLLEADGWGWPDNIKKGYLKAAISTTLLTAMVGTREAVSYEGYCDQLRMTSDQLDEVKEKKKLFVRTKDRVGPMTSPKGEVNDVMDWEPSTGASAARSKRQEPRWASDDEIDRRRREGLCLRCGEEGHRVRQCRTKLTATKEVRTKPTRVATMEKKKEGPSAQSDEEGLDSEASSGKE